MTAPPLRKPCPDCKGRGVVPRTRRYIDGVPDPFDTRTEELCQRCGGSGSVPDAGPASEAVDMDSADCCS